MDVLKFGFRFWKRNIGLSLLAKLMSGIALAADLLLPMITALFVDYIIQDSQIDNENIFSFMLTGQYGQPHTMDLFLHLAGLFGGLLILKLILVYWKNILNQKLGLRMETDLRIETFNKLMTLDSATISDYNTGELLTTLSSDTIMFKDMFCRILPNIYDSVFVLVVAVILLGTISPYLLIIPLIMIPVFVFALMRFKRRAMYNFRDIRGCNSEMNLTVQENIEAVRLIRSFTNEEKEKDKFNVSNERLKNAYVKQVKLSANFEALFKGIVSFAYVGSIGVSAVLVMTGHVRTGFLVACADYILKIMNYINMINNNIFQMQQQLVSGQKMMNFMACETRIPEGNIELDRDKKHIPDIKFDHVSLEIEGKKILSDISIDIPAGKKVGIVGGTGSGKSTLLESLIRIHD
ncbi:MAG: ABC transporter ATP-binding protein/permease, partial [Eubacterium sp.]|nr:ABC transporter ATP-binding protein/permease [Eubacterium sp.]